MPDYSITDIVESINKLSAEQRNEIISKLSAAAAPRGSVMTFSQSMLAAASNPSRLIELRQLKAMAARHSIDLPENEKIEIAKLNKQLREQNVDTTTRMNLKSMMYRAGMIPA